jgi:anthranilate/para-aminobenzoate synthase component I
VILHAEQRATDRATLEAGADPLDVLAGWPARTPLVAIVSGPGARRTVLATPASTSISMPGEALARVGAASGDATRGWIGVIDYEAGRAIEPRAGDRSERCPGMPVARWQRVESAMVHDRVTGVWTRVGDGVVPFDGVRRPARVGELVAVDGRDKYEANVARAIEYIHAGDVYQANVAHRMAAPFEGSARALFVELMRASGAWFGAYLEWDDERGRHAVLSASPELFLTLDGATGRVVTRPMKGTARADSGSRLDTEKDRAELNMIVDLMRNDLGRVCQFGSVRVEQAQAVERHASGDIALHQGVATIAGLLRRGLGLEDLLRATFPGGSVTGAPKIRAMQIIDELEGFDRGAFCGSIGHVTDDGNATFNIAIRTATISGEAGGAGADDFAGATLTYPVGAGIVADSAPAAEWAETMAKAGVLRAAIERLRSGV